ncbi:hypothetical protein ACFL60_09355, partial [Candidatus Omnitrophota bacterium]
MRKLPLAVVFLVVLSISCGSVQEQGRDGYDRIGCTIETNFETGDLFAWESYPYAQDIGFDPTLLCQKEPAHNSSRYALARIVKPNDALDLSQGFTKQIDLWTTDTTHVTFALFLMSDRKPDKVEVALGLFDGRLYKHTLMKPDVNRWVEIDIPLEKFNLEGHSLLFGEHVQVLTITALYPLVSHLMSYTILIDDFAINGERQRRFIALNPESTDFDMFGISILNKHFFYKDTVGISATAEGKKKLTQVTCNILDSEGKEVISDMPLYDDGSHGDEKSGNGVWTNDSIYTIKETDIRGQWTINLIGETGGGADVSWGFRFLMPGKRLMPQDHPRLFFTAEELAERMASDESPAAKKLLKHLISGGFNYDVDIDSISEGENIPTESISGGPYSRVTDDYTRWRGPMSRLGSITSSGAWRYAFTGDEKAGQTAKKA